MTKQVILTGIRANNDLHLGNYLGALLPMVNMAKKHGGDYQVNLFVPDLHSFTTPIDHSTFNDDIMNNLRVFVAAGLPLDNPDVHIYRQSYIPAHSELAWIFNCFTGFGELSRMTEFKDKSTRLGVEHIGVGQFDYPVLMAATFCYMVLRMCRLARTSVSTLNLPETSPKDSIINLETYLCCQNPWLKCTNSLALTKGCEFVTS